MSDKEGETLSTPDKQQPGFSLDSILNGEHDNLPEDPSAQASDEETPEKTASQGYCVECEGEARLARFVSDKHSN